MLWKTVSGSNWEELVTGVAASPGVGCIQKKKGAYAPLPIQLELGYRFACR